MAPYPSQAKRRPPWENEVSIRVLCPSLRSDKTFFSRRGASLGPAKERNRADGWPLSALPQLGLRSVPLPSGSRSLWRIGTERATRSIAALRWHLTAFTSGGRLLPPPQEGSVWHKEHPRPTSHPRISSHGQSMPWITPSSLLEHEWSLISVRRVGVSRPPACLLLKSGRFSFFPSSQIE